MNRMAGLLTAGGLALLGVLATPVPAQAAPLSLSAPAAVAPGAEFEVQGTKEPDATVTVDLPGCDVPAEAETWSCTAIAAEGRNVVTATQVLGDATTTASVDVIGLTAPTFTGAALTNGRLTGGGYSGADVILDAGAWNLTCPVNGSGAWACDVPNTPSGEYVVAATQQIGNSAGASGSFSITLDRDAPAAPSLAAPTAGQQLPPGPIDIRGSGEPGATAELRLNGALVCSVLVAESGWSCTFELRDGSYDVQVLQF
ncbi:MAG TPA: hypothetical protein VN200_12015, partial [Rhodoglobus sp.]|nr:hypothetical protein [Rhodoglobus sp.]